MSKLSFEESIDFKTKENNFFQFRKQNKSVHGAVRKCIEEFIVESIKFSIPPALTFILTITGRVS